MVCRQRRFAVIGEIYPEHLIRRLAQLALVFVECFPRALIGIFGAQNESVYYTDFAVRAFRIYLCMIVLACVNKATFIFLQAMGKAVESTLLSMVREIVFGVGFALLLPRFFGLSGVLWSMPVSDILTAVISAVIILKTYRQLRAARREAGREAGREAEREAERAQVVSG